MIVGKWLFRGSATAVKIVVTNDTLITAHQEDISFKYAIITHLIPNEELNLLV